MKRRSFIIILLLTHVLLFVGGFYFGKIITFQDSMKKANFIGSLGMLSEYVRVQLERGSCREATEALFSYERMLEEFKKRDGSLISDDIYFFDKVLTYTRLMKIARKQRDTTRVSEYLSLAQKACGDAKWADCSEKSLMDKTERIDRKISIKCFTEPG
jgi:hypothetical protein